MAKRKKSTRRRRVVRSEGNRYIVHSKKRAVAMKAKLRAKRPKAGLRRHVKIKGPLRKGYYSVSVHYTRRHHNTGW